MYLLVSLARESGKEVSYQFLQFLIRFLSDLVFLGNGGQKILVAGLDVLGEFLLESGDLGGVKFVKVTTYTTVDDGNLIIKT